MYGIKRSWLRCIGLLVAVLVVGLGNADDTLRDDLVVGFEPPHGIYQYFDDLTWSQLHPFTPGAIVPADLNRSGRSELIIDFGSPYGLWVRRDGTSWHPFHPTSPEQFIVADLDFNGMDEVIADFGPSGLWVRYNDTNWVMLDSRDASLIASAQLDEDLRDELIVSLPGIGTWVRANDSEWWPLHPGIPQSVESARLCGEHDGLVIDFPSPYGIYLYCRDQYFWQEYPTPYEWLEVHPGTAESFTAGQLDDDWSPEEVIFDFGASGTWVLINAQPSNGWAQLHPFSPRHMAIAEIDAGDGPDIVLDFHGAGIWALHDLSFWQQKNPNSSAILEVANTNRPLYSCADLFVEGHLIEADECFDARLDLDPDDLEAHLLKAVTLLARVFTEEPEVAAAFGLPGDGGLDLGVGVATFQTLLDGFGAEAEDRNPLNFTAGVPVPFPKGSPDGGEIQEVVNGQFVAALDAALDDHLSLIGPGFETMLDSTDAVGIDPPIDVDYADAKLLEAALRSIKGVALRALVLQNLDIDIAALTQQSHLGEPIQAQRDVLDPNPLLLTFYAGAAAGLAEARSELTTALDCYYIASDFIRNDDDPNQLDDLITIDFDPLSLAEEEQLRRELGSVYCSLDGLGFTDLDADGFPLCGGPPMIDELAIDLSTLFVEANDLRGLIPILDWEETCEMDYIDTTVVDEDTPFPDPELGGLFPGLTQPELLGLFGIPGNLEPGYRPVVMVPAGQTTQFYQYHTYDADLSAPISVSEVAYDPGSVFAVDPASLPTLPLSLCSFDQISFGSFFSPASDGAYQENVVMTTSRGPYRSPVLGCTGDWSDCNNDGTPDWSSADLGRCIPDGRAEPSPGTGTLIDACTGQTYQDMDPSDGDGRLDDCDCDGFEDLYPDRGKCVTGNGLLPSPGSGSTPTDPCSGMPYSDTEPGLGDGKVDDCDCNGWADF